jgi:hypothetical protein
MEKKESWNIMSLQLSFPHFAEFHAAEEWCAIVKPVIKES